MAKNQIMGRVVMILILIAIVGAAIAAALAYKSTPPLGTTAPECPHGTIESYLGTTCAAAGVTYTFYPNGFSFKTTGGEPNLSASDFFIRLDPNGNDTLLIGSPYWNMTSAGQSFNMTWKFRVSGAGATFGWLHYCTVSGNGQITGLTILSSGTTQVSTANAFCTTTVTYNKFRLNSSISLYKYFSPTTPYNVTLIITAQDNGGSVGLQSYGEHFWPGQRP